MIYILYTIFFIALKIRVTIVHFYNSDINLVTQGSAIIFNIMPIINAFYFKIVTFWIRDFRMQTVSRAKQKF